MIIPSQITTLLDQLEHMPSESLESDIVEFKAYSSEAALHNAKDLSEEISALANQKGGLIVVGVRDSRSVAHGMWPDQLCGFERVDLFTTMERLRGKLKPSTIALELADMEHRGKNYLVIKVPHRRDLLVATASGKVCIRDGKSSRPMTPDEIEQAVKNLQNYDWSSESLELSPAVLNETSVQEALSNFASRRNLTELDTPNFLEAIGATHNGILTRCGLLFLVKSDVIREQLGRFEYRFSRKTASGKLLINDVWEDCLWETIKRGKARFDQCNDPLNLTFQGKEYLVQLLDKVVFHEAYLNALVHRDYSVDGMVSVNFTGDRLIITSPGTFYGGITPENIAKHEPRHRNKALAKMLMEYHLVDRAGMGVLRMSVSSLKYGRAFPEFLEDRECVEVIMQGEYLRPGIFALVTDEGADYGIPELLILNMVYDSGFVPVQLLTRQLAKVSNDPWNAFERALSQLPSVELCGTREGVFVRVKPEWNKIFKVSKTFRITTASPKHVQLYRYLAHYGSASNADIKAHLGLRQTSQTSAFLKSAAYVKRSGRGPSSVWSLKEKE